MTLPIESILPRLISAIRSSNHAVLQAPPGAGKTTRVPLALLDAKLFDGKIIMLEPRRLAARAAAERLAYQLKEPTGKTIGYAMRGAHKTTKSTKIDIVTEGILTRMIQSDPELNGVSCIIFDEFHERSLQADLGLALCLEIRNAFREDLCLIVMSATLDAEPVAKLMGNAPIITSKGRSFPVDTRFLNKPWSKPHQNHPRLEHAMADLIIQAVQETQGSLLAFLPGEGEIRRVQAIVETKLKSILDTRPLFGAMPFTEQQKAISPSKRRKLVLATSIAETSLTIEGIHVVIDSGYRRYSHFNTASGMSKLTTARVTKAQAIQRQGRAGRLCKGVCYKLWTKGEDGGLIPYPSPEILTADLTSLALELAAWGVNDPKTLPFLTYPREVDFSTAQNLLRKIGALDHKNFITNLGKKIAKLPLHPRLARLLIFCGEQAKYTAALLAEHDILNYGAPSDLTLRQEALNNPTKFEKTRPYHINHTTLRRVKADIKRLTPTGKQTLSLAQMAALAYPDRIGLHRKTDAPRFLLSGGSGAYFKNDDPLGSQRLIVATDLEGQQKEACIRIGIAISEAELRMIYADQFITQHICEWSKRGQRILTKKQTCFGALILNEQNWRDCPNHHIATALLNAIKDLGLTSLNMNKSSYHIQARIEWLRARGCDFPDCSNVGLMKNLEGWLFPYLNGIKSLEALKELEISTLINAQLSYEQQQQLNHLAPKNITAPTGTELVIDYTSETPKISVRLQELFGIKTHPTIGPDRLKILIELLSPARRPVQTTADLPNFWKNSYADVRKDMRGRYPKHPWPTNPQEASPTKRLKPR